MSGTQESWNSDKVKAVQAVSPTALCPGSAGPPGAREVQATLEQFVCLDHLGLAADFVAVDLKLPGTDRLGRECKVKGFRENFYLGCTLETFRPVVLVVRGES